MTENLRAIPLMKPYISHRVKDALEKTLDSGQIGQGPKVEEFEWKLKDFLRDPNVGSPHICCVNSATSALHMLYHQLKCLDPDRDEILTTPISCNATYFPMLANGFKIKWVDLNPGTMNIDTADLARKITWKTAAIVIVHWGGCPADLKEINDIVENARRHLGSYPNVIEDCAHAFGATYQGKKLGNHDNLCVFSFQAVKHLTTGDGGMITVPSGEGYLCQALRSMRWYGMNRNLHDRHLQDVEKWGFKFNMTDIDATIGIENLKDMDWLISRHQANAVFLRKRLAFTDGVRLLHYQEDRQSSDWLFTIRVERRSEFIRSLRSRGIEASQVHGRADLLSCMLKFKSLLPNTDVVANDFCCIPCGWWLNTEELEYIVECIKKGW